MTVPPETESPSVAGVLLAAGTSSRMGRPKALLPFSSRTLFIEETVARLEAGGAHPIHVVLGAGAETVRSTARLPDVRVIVNENFEQGQLSSLQAGVRSLPADAAAAIIALVDQPHVPARVTRLLIEAFRRSRAPIVRPVWQGRGGHPFLVSREVFAPLLDLGPDATAFDVVKNFRDRRCDVAAPDASVLEDFDTPESYDEGGFPRG